MPATVPGHLSDLFAFERPIVCALATTMPDGQPQVTPVWFDFDGQYFIVNTARGRQKDRNMRRNARVTLLMIDPEDSNHWAEVRGRIVEETEQGAPAVIAHLALKYRGREEFSIPSGQVRVTYKIAADKINGE